MRLATLSLAFSLLLVPSMGLAESMRAVQPTTHEILVGSGSVNVEQGIPQATVNALYRLLSPEARSGTRPSIYRVPQFSTLYVVTANLPNESTDGYGLSLYVFQQEGAAFKQLFQSRGMDDSYILRPTFFVGQERTLIMAETGDETGTWQVHGFDVNGSTVAYVGTLDAAKSDPKNPDGWSNPIENARVEFVDNSYVIHVHGEVFLRPGREGQKKLPGMGWHKFVLDGAEFVYGQE